MTPGQYVRDYLEKNGMWGNDVDAVIAEIKSSKINESMIGRWDDDTKDYPAGLLIVLTLGAKDIAFEWIEKHKQRAWYKPLFAK